MLNEQEFREHFLIPNDISICLQDGEPTSTVKTGDIFFTKEQFNARLCLLLPSLLKQFLQVSQIPLAFIHPNIIWVLMGCCVLDMLFQLDLSVLEVLFVYTIKKGKTNMFSMFAHIPSLQLMTGLPNSIKGRAKGYVLVKGHWAGLTNHASREFEPNLSMNLPSTNSLRSLPLFLLLFAFVLF